MDFEHDFSSWLRAHNYREGTVRLTVRQTKQALGVYRERPEAGYPKSTLTSLKRALAFLLETRTQRGFTRWLQGQDVGTPTGTPVPKPKQRQLEAHSFSQDDYRAICAACLQRKQAAHPEAHVIYTIARTGLRIGDVLRIPIADLQRAVDGAKSGESGILPIERKGGSWVHIPILGALDAWENLRAHAEDYATVAGFVTDGESDSAEAGDMAYARVNRYFKGLGEDLGLSGRIHLHRLRRTVAVRALKATEGDLIGVQQLLGHKTVTSTQRYVDEIDAQRVAGIQQKIR